MRTHTLHLVLGWLRHCCRSEGARGESESNTMKRISRRATANQSLIQTLAMNWLRKKSIRTRTTLSSLGNPFGPEIDVAVIKILRQTLKFGWTSGKARQNHKAFWVYFLAFENHQNPILGLLFPVLLGVSLAKSSEHKTLCLTPKKFEACNSSNSKKTKRWRLRGCVFEV